MAVVTMRQLLESGVHFGHQTRRWNPKMKRFIFTERNGIYIIDLQQSLTLIGDAYEFVRDTVARGGSIMFVGTKKQAQEPIAAQAARVGMPYVNQRWLGGMLTNFQTVNKRLQRLRELEAIDFDDVAGSSLTKKELLVLRREKEKLEKTLGGIRDMGKTPSAVWIVDTKKEHLAVDEAHKLGIPVVAILDTNCDPDEVEYKIPGNDDAIRSVALLTRVIADAVADGLMARSNPQASGAASGDEPLAAWERELLEQGSAASSNGAATAAAAVPAAASVSEPASPAPATVEPGTVEPATVEPATVEPATVEPATVEPATVEPGTVAPAAGTEVEEPAEPGLNPVDAAAGVVDDAAASGFPTGDTLAHTSGETVAATVEAATADPATGAPVDPVADTTTTGPAPATA